MSPSNGRRSSGGEGVNCNYIEHQVSKFDTLAGVAIKYGVEVLLSFSLSLSRSFCVYLRFASY
jgi:hypothetical protein